MSVIRVGIIGCGNIAGAYCTDLKTYPFIELRGVTDIDKAKATQFAADHQTRAYDNVGEMLTDPDVDLVVNLTTPHAHKAVITWALQAGKHVYTEKPLATNYGDAAGLVAMAEQNGLRLGASPFTLMGEAQQTAWQLIRSGKAGKIRLAYAEVNWGRIESWHPAPGPFYEVGALYDVGVYPLTILTALFGPVQQVQAYGTVLYPDRVTREGTPFSITTPDFMVTLLEFADGAVARLTTNFYVGHHNRQTGIEFHGDLGSVYLSSWQNFNATVEYANFGGRYEPVPLLREPYEGTPWGRGIADMAAAILDNRPHRFTGEQAAHVVEVLDAAAKAARTKSTVAVQSTFTPPTPLEWAD